MIIHQEEGPCGKMLPVMNKVKKSAQKAHGIDISPAIQRIDLTAAVFVELLVFMTISYRLNDPFLCS